MRLTRPAILLPLALLALAGCAAQSLGTHREWYAARGARPPAGDQVYICHAFTCRRVTPVLLTASELDEISAPLSVAAADASAERAMISRSVQAFERVVGRRVGTSGDRGGLDIANGNPGQMDCLDEATNTTSLLLVLSEKGLLRHHRPMHPVARGIFLDGRYPHATAVIAETALPVSARTQWAIDSWPTANAEPPVIQRLDAWLAARPGGSPESG